MKLGIVIPAYKRPEYLERTLASIDGYRGGPVMVVDDGTPDCSVIAAASAASIHSIRQPHAGIVCALATGIEVLAPQLGGGDAIMLLAADHELPKGWAGPMAAGAGAGLVPGICDVGQVEHVPGLKRVDGWRSDSKAVAPGVSICRDLDCWHVVCSMPSLLTIAAARKLAAFIRGDTPRDRRQPHNAQKTFQAFVASCLPGQKFFALLGDGVRIDHFGHHTGVRPGFVGGHEAYYQEIGRR